MAPVSPLVRHRALRLSCTGRDVSTAYGDRFPRAMRRLFSPAVHDSPEPLSSLLHVYNSYQNVLYAVDLAREEYAGHFSMHDHGIAV